jgi:hypothetical protein
VKPGDRLYYFLEADGRVSLVPKIYTVADLVGILPPSARAISVEDMNHAITEHASSLK